MLLDIYTLEWIFYYFKKKKRSYNFERILFTASKFVAININLQKKLSQLICTINPLNS